MKIKLFDNITVTAEPEEVYMLLWIHNKMSKSAPAPVIAPETPESAAPAVVAVETPEAPKASRKPAIDWPKAQALRKAGWSLAKIADELGVSVPTVSAHLKEVKA
jgi:hypothetical protein